MNAARMDRGQLFYRSPAAVGDQESGSVPGSSRRDRSVFVENLEPVELDHVLVIALRVRIELAQSELLETPHRGRRIRVDRNRIPSFEDLRPQAKRLIRRSAKLEWLAARAKAVDE